MRRCLLDFRALNLRYKLTPNTMTLKFDLPIKNKLNTLVKGDASFCYWAYVLRISARVWDIQVAY